MSKRSIVVENGDVARKCRRSTPYGLHELNPYNQRTVDFVKLASKYPETFGKFFAKNGSQSFDWQDASALRCLTETLLNDDFGLDVVLHPSRLCPKLPNRLNYLCWLHDLFEHVNSTKRIHVLDIGVGANAVYPLLGNKLFGWRFTGTDIDADSIAWASKNVLKTKIESNEVKLLHVEVCTPAQKIFAQETVNLSEQLKQYLSENIKLQECRGPLRNACRGLGLLECTERKEVALEARLASLGEKVLMISLRELFFVDEVLDEMEEVTACMTNPPFYDIADRETIQSSGHSVCTGSETEMRTLGGEVAFLSALIFDSLVLQKSGARWYTCMVGKKGSIKTLRGFMRDAGVPIVHSTRFTQGRTMRWGLAWSFYKDNPPLSIYTKRSLGRKDLFTVKLASEALRQTQFPHEVEERASNVTLVKQRVLLALEEIEKKKSEVLSINQNLTVYGEEVEEKTRHDIAFTVSTAIPCNVDRGAQLLYRGRIRFLTGTEDAIVKLEVELEQCNADSSVMMQVLSLKDLRDTLEQHLLRSNRRWRRVLDRAGKDEKKKEN